MTRITEVLLVDDNPADIDLIRDVLMRSRCPSHIQSVLNGVEALAFLHHEGKYTGESLPDLMMLDLNMPRKDGRAVLTEVKSDPGLKKTPIVIFSTSQARQDVAFCYASGANGYVSKPGNLQEFILAVTSIADFWFCNAQLPDKETQ